MLAPSRSGVPALLHWGADLGALDDDALAGLVASHAPRTPHSSLDEPRWPALVAQPGDGFTGLPALEGLRPSRLGEAGGTWSPRPGAWTWDLEDTGPDAVLLLDASDDEAGWAVRVELELTREGLVRLRSSVTNRDSDALVVLAVRNALPVAAHATELLDLTGRWCRERHPQRRAWHHGTHLRGARHGRTGHDATLLLAAGTPGFGFGRGEVWAVHTAWSGDHTTYAERTPEADVRLGGSELLGPGEVVLATGEGYVSPWLVGSYSGSGLDPVSHRLHDWTRRHAPRSRSPRPVLVNTWEAAYFEHDLERLTPLARAASRVGVERFVLDDGWFRGRRHDRAGLGDWTVDTAVWPEGLGPLIERVHGLGMDFGLWVEPEMVNTDSDLAREHPDWILRGRGTLPDPWRHQQVLDLQMPAAWAHVRNHLHALLETYDIAYLKWDHNRDLIDVAHDGRPAVRGQTLAFYALLDDLRAAHPGLEVESCASGGGRIDAEVLSRTDRVWPSDTIDALERQTIQRWTTMLVPPEMSGAHLGGPVAHTTGRTHTLGYRAATALLGHLGIEWDLGSLSDDELAEVAAWVALHRELRPIVATSRVVRGDHPDPAVGVTGLVSADADEGWFVVATVASVATATPLPVQLPGLDPTARYRLRDRTPAGGQHDAADLGERWTSDGLVLPGSALERLGVRLPVLPPEHARVLHVVREPEAR